MNKFLKKRIWLPLIFTISHALNLPAQEYFEAPFIFKCNISIWDIVVDKNNFIWLGGTGGLNRFDGQSFKSFRHNSKDSISAIPKQIRHLLYDEENHKLWLSAWEDGISAFDLNTEKIKNYNFSPDGITGPPVQSFYWTFKDKYGTIWSGSQKDGLVQFRSESEGFKHLPYQPLPEDKAFSYSLLNRFESHAQDVNNDSILWIGTGTGLQRFNVITEKYQHFPILPYLSDLHGILSIYAHPNGKLYLGTWGAGLFVFDPITKKYQSNKWKSFSKEHSRGDHTVRKILPKSQDRLWLTMTSGMLEYDIPSQQIVKMWTNDKTTVTKYGAKYLDKRNRIYTWHGNQLEIYDSMRQQAQRFHMDYQGDSLLQIARHFYEDPIAGVIWMAVQVSSGLYQLDLNSGQWKIFPPDPSTRKNQKEFLGWDILKNQEGKLLVLDEDLIYEFSEQQQKIIPYSIQTDLSEPEYRCFIEDRNGNLWIGTHQNGLIKIDPVQRTVRIYKEELYRHPDLKSVDAIWDLKEDRNGNIWIRGNGCSVYDFKRDTFYNFPYLYPQEKKKQHSEALGLDVDGNVWVSFYPQHLGGTDADHPEKGYVKYYTSNEGLTIYNPGQLELDTEGNLWVAAGHLEKINTRELSSELYTVQYFAHGYVWGMKSLSDGRMILGHKKSVSIIHPFSLKKDTITPIPYVKSFKIFEEEQATALPLYRTTDVHLKPGENFFSFEISAINPSYFPEMTFEYKLEGIDPQWINPGNRRYVAYTDIRPGTHIFKLIAKNREGVTSRPYELRIHIAAPWYKKWWAFLLYFLIIGFVSFKIIQFQNRRRQLRQQLYLEQQEAVRLKELDEAKNRLFTNITHEFRTPLTVIQGLADQIRANPKWKVEEQTDMIKRNSSKLLDLINQMLDLSKLEAGKMDVHYIQADVVAYLKYLVESFHSLAFARKINISFYSHLEHLVMDYEPEKYQRILSNLVSNAIKFTPEYGKITVAAREVEQANMGRWLELKVEDSGMGIPKDNLPHIFDRFYQVDNSSLRQGEGTGIGLALVKELVQLLNGQIQVKSEVGKGTRFTLLFPIRQQAEKRETEDVIAQTGSLPVGTTLVTDPAFDRPLTQEMPLVLLVEDNADVTYYLRSCLDGLYQIEEARNGRQGIDKALEMIPDLIVSDVMMPEMDGFELCEAMKTDERTNHIPIVLLTAKVTQEDKLRGLTHGADAYLTKPFQKEELLIRLEKLIQLRKQLQERFQKHNGQADTPEDAFLKKVDERVNEHMDDADYSVVQLSRDLGMSRAQLHRKLKALTDLSATQYLRLIRMNKALELLRNSDLTIAEIGYEVGFKDPSHFSRVFSEHFGKSPSETRK